MQWKIVYNLVTGICTAVNSRDPQEGEGIIYLDSAVCGWVNVYPERYKVVDGALVERPEWAAEKAFNEKKIADEIAVRATFDVDSEAPVATPYGIFNGGQDSAGYIQGAVGLAQALGETEVQITDTNNVAHTMSFTEAMTVAALVGKQFRTAFMVKQAALVEIANRVMA